VQLFEERKQLQFMSNSKIERNSSLWCALDQKAAEQKHLQRRWKYFGPGSEETPSNVSVYVELNFLKHKWRSKWIWRREKNRAHLKNCEGWGSSSGRISSLGPGQPFLSISDLRNTSKDLLGTMRLTKTYFFFLFLLARPSHATAHDKLSFRSARYP